MGNKFLVTGAGGFIGTALCRCLAQKRGVKVLGIGRSSMTSADFHYHRLSLLNKNYLKKYLKQERPDIIFHLAGGRSGNSDQLVSDNVSTTINLFEAICSMGDYHPRVVIAGSSAEYGEISGPRRPILENASAHPAGLYGRVKLLQTRIGLHYADLGEDVIIARLFNILGPHIPQDMAAGRFAHELVHLEKSSKSKIMEVSSLDAMRDFLDIRDICEALILLSTKGRNGKIYNISSQKGIFMRDLLDAMITAAKGTGIEIKENKKNKPGVIYAVGSNVKLRRVTGWKPQYNLLQSIRDTLASYRQKHRSV